MILFDLMLSDLDEWTGSNPPKSSMCPYTVQFIAKPMPSQSLNSLEAGKVKITVNLGGSITIPVKWVTARMVNNAKRKIVDKIDGDSEIKKNTFISITLKQHEGAWLGEFSIPVTWIEGGTNTYEKTGSFNPDTSSDLFQMDISYELSNGKRCIAKFFSSDAFHWASKSDTKVK